MSEKKISRGYVQPPLDKYPSWATAEFRAWFCKEWRKITRKLLGSWGSSV